MTGAGLQYIGAGLAMLVGIGVGLSEGLAGAKAVEAVSKTPENKSDITSTLIIGDAMTDISIIFAFVIAILLVMK